MDVKRKLNLLNATNILSLIAIFLTAYQIRESKYEQIESNINQEVTYTMEMMFPCWLEWKDLYYKAQKLDGFDKDFLAKASLAQDRWNVTLNTLDIEEGKIDEATIDSILHHIKLQNYHNIKKIISTILEDKIDCTRKNFMREIQIKREEVKNKRNFFD